MARDCGINCMEIFAEATETDEILKERILRTSTKEFY